jgi:hypothetical protein
VTIAFSPSLTSQCDDYVVAIAHVTVLDIVVVVAGVAARRAVVSS